MKTPCLICNRKEFQENTIGLCHDCDVNDWIKFNTTSDLRTTNFLNYSLFYLDLSQAKLLQRKKLKKLGILDLENEV